MVLASNNRNRGKALERYIAKTLGGKRMGVLGGEDVMHDKYSIECKSRKSFIGSKFMEQCIRNNKDNKIPMVVVHQCHTPYEDSFVMLRLKDFLNLDS